MHLSYNIIIIILHTAHSINDFIDICVVFVCGGESFQYIVILIIIIVIIVIVMYRRIYKHDNMTGKFQVIISFTVYDQYPRCYAIGVNVFVRSEYALITVICRNCSVNWFFWPFHWCYDQDDYLYERQKNPTEWFTSR